MWRKRITDIFGLLFISILILCGLQRTTEGQNLGLTQQKYDPSTERSLQRLQQLMVRGSYEEVKELIQRIIDGSGYIPPLAEVFYRLAQNESESDTLVGQYMTIVDNWPASAWAQKAVVELVPLILMSGGDLGANAEAKIWRHQAELLAPSQDATLLGENPEDLQGDVFIHLLELAHFRNNQTVQVQALVNQIPPRAAAHQDQIELAAAYATLRTQKREEARAAFHQWLNKYPQSDYRPLAHLALFLASDTESQRDEALRLLLDTFPDSLETMWLRSTQGGRMQ